MNEAWLLFLFAAADGSKSHRPAKFFEIVGLLQHNFCVTEKY